MTTLSVAAKINATDYGPLGSGTVFFPSIAAASFGAFFSDTAHFDIREIKVGTTGYGSSDLFAPVLADLSEFDGVYGNDGSIVASGGVLSVDSTSGDHYAYKGFTPITAIIYFQFQLRVRSGDGQPDYADAWDSAASAGGHGTPMDGIFNNIGVWGWDGPGTNFGSGPSGDPTWDTVNLTFSLVTPPPPTVPFHIAS